MKAVTRQKRLDEKGSWEVYVGDRPIAYGLTKGEQRRVKRIVERRLKRFEEGAKK
jgi:hypothetical protein